MEIKVVLASGDGSFFLVGDLEDDLDGCFLRDDDEDELEDDGGRDFVLFE